MRTGSSCSIKPIISLRALCFLGLSVIVAARQYFCLGLHQLLRLKWDFFILHFPNEPVANFLVHAVWCWAGMHSEFVIAYLMRTAAYCCRKDSWQKWLKLLLSVSLWDLNHWVKRGYKALMMLKSWVKVIWLFLTISSFHTLLLICCLYEMRLFNDNYTNLFPVFYETQDLKNNVGLTIKTIINQQ